MDSDARWLIIGAGGMLGRDLMAVCEQAGNTVIGMDLPEIDITSSASVRAALDSFRPQVVVNAAAYTAVDAAEDHEDEALLINGEGPRLVAEEVARHQDVRLVQVSTDYVFAGDADSPYPEDYPPAPKSAYGRTKLAGEQAVLTVIPDRSYIVRTAWLYGVHGKNFVKTMLRLESNQPTVSVVDDQWGQPTWTHDLSRQLVRLVQSGAPVGIYHGTASGRATWREFAAEIFRLSGADPTRVLPIASSDFPQRAQRPGFSVLGHAAWGRAGLRPMRDWREALAAALPLIMAPDAVPHGGHIG